MVFFNAAGALEQVSQEPYMVSACLVLTPVWPDFDCAVPEVVAAIAQLFSTPSPFLLSSLFVPLLAHCRPSLPAFLSLRHIWADYSWTPTWAGFRCRLPGPWPAAWTRGGVELNCELNVSYVFSFVESGCAVDGRPSYPRVKGMCTTVDGYGLCVQS